MHICVGRSRTLERQGEGEGGRVAQVRAGRTCEKMRRAVGVDTMSTQQEARQAKAKVWRQRGELELGAR